MIEPTSLDQPPRVLIVEDDPVCTTLYRETLLDLVPELQVIEANHGYDALGKLAQVKPDLMILDLQMPSFDGIDLLSLIAAKSSYSDLPVVVISSAPDLADEIVGRLANAHVFLKPMRPALLQKVVWEALRLSPNGVLVTASGYRGDAHRLARVIAAQFYELLPERLAHLERYFARRDKLTLQEWCHAMEGTASVVGATALLDAIRKLEVAIKTEDFSSCASTVENVVREARNFAVALDKAFTLSDLDVEQ